MKMKIVHAFQTFCDRQEKFEAEYGTVILSSLTRTSAVAKQVHPF